MHLAAKEIAIYHSSVYPALAKIEKPENGVLISKYHDMIKTRKALALFKANSTNEEVYCQEFRDQYLESIPFLESDEVQQFLENFNSENYRFVMAHNDMHN